MDFPGGKEYRERGTIPTMLWGQTKGEGGDTGEARTLWLYAGRGRLVTRGQSSNTAAEVEGLPGALGVGFSQCHAGPRAGIFPGSCQGREPRDQGISFPGNIQDKAPIGFKSWKDRAQGSC